jgi:hypothetical protein
MYQGTINEERIIFLRQVDDFAVASKHEKTAQLFLDTINALLRIPLKSLGLVNRFNGNDIHQTRKYIKINQEKYLTKMLGAHKWLVQTQSKTPIPLPSDSKWVQQLETATCPTTIDEQKLLKEKMGFHYRQVIGEVIFPMMKAQRDICFHATKLSQYMENPGEAHYLALRELCTYLAQTVQDSIYYWRDEPRMDLSNEPLPTLYADNYQLEVHPEHHNNTLYGYVDADWASDIKHRKSVSGIVVMYAGGAVGYKSKYQDNIAHSTTEAEFTAACDAAKQILFFRSVLDEMNIEQHHATPLYEDNAGALLMANAQQPTR